MARRRRRTDTGTRGSTEPQTQEPRFARLLEGAGIGGWLRRQRLEGWELDFYFPRERVAVEIDGYFHVTSETMARDSRKDIELEGWGIRVLRFTNAEVRVNPDGCLAKLRDTLAQRADGPEPAGDLRVPVASLLDKPTSRRS